MKTLLERIVVNFLGKPKEPPVAPKKTLLEQITEEFLSEEKIKAVKIGTDGGSDRIVWFGSKDSLDKKKEKGTHRDFKTDGSDDDLPGGRKKKKGDKKEPKDTKDEPSPEEKEKEVQAAVDAVDREKENQGYDQTWLKNQVAGIKGGPTSGLLNELATVDERIVGPAEEALDKFLEGETAEEKLADLTGDDNYEAAVQAVCDHLEADENFMDSALATATVSRKKDKPGKGSDYKKDKQGGSVLKTPSKARICKIAGSIVANRLLILDAEAKHGWDTKATTSERYIGSDDDLERAVEQVDSFAEEHDCKSETPAVLVTPRGTRIPFCKDGEPNTITYRDKDGNVLEDTVAHVVKYHIEHSGAGENAGDTFILSENGMKPGELMLHNISNKMSLDDQLAHSSPEQDLQKRLTEIDKLEQEGTLKPKQAEQAREIMREGAEARAESDKKLATSTQPAARVLLDKTSGNDAKSKARMAQLEYAFETGLVPTRPDCKPGDDCWRKPNKQEGAINDKRRNQIKKFPCEDNPKKKGFGCWMTAMQNQENMRKTKKTGEAKGPTADDRKIMQRLASRFNPHWDDEGLDVPSKIAEARTDWITADEAEHAALQKIKVEHTMTWTNAEGEPESKQIKLGLGDKVLAEEIATSIHYHFADENYEDTILSDTSVTNNGGTVVTGDVLRDCLGVDNKSQFLAGVRRGETRQITDDGTPEGNVTGELIQHVALV